MSKKRYTGPHLLAEMPPGEYTLMVDRISWHKLELKLRKTMVKSLGN